MSERRLRIAGRALHIWNQPAEPPPGPFEHAIEDVQQGNRPDDADGHAHSPGQLQGLEERLQPESAGEISPQTCYEVPRFSSLFGGEAWQELARLGIVEG
jgi:hypothetical protein